VADRAKIEALAIAVNNTVSAHLPLSRNEVIAALESVAAAYIADIPDDDLRDATLRNTIRALRLRVHGALLPSEKETVN
jgi:hypothetical protein